MSVLLAWLGGALFVASLAYTGYFFVVILGNSAPAGARSIAAALFANVVLFGVFAAHHSLFARGSVKRLFSRWIPMHMERSAYVWLASLLLLAVFWAWQLVPGTLYRADGILRWLLYAVQLAGVYLTVRAAGAIEPLELAGIHQATGTAVSTRFRTDGPFGLVRHPIYLGWLLMVFASPSMTVNRFVFAVITSAYLVIAIPWEERSLTAGLGEQYRRYQASVRWRLIPGLW